MTDNDAPADEAAEEQAEQTWRDGWSEGFAQGSAAEQGGSARERAARAMRAVGPLDGPYDGESTVAAALVLYEAVRYLNHATRHGEAVPHPAVADRVLGSVDEATGAVRQLLRQLGERVTAHGTDPDAYVSEGEPLGEGGRQVLAEASAEVAVSILTRASEKYAEASMHVDRGRQYVARMGIDRDDQAVRGE